MKSTRCASLWRATARTTGEGFFQSLLRHLAVAVDVSHAFVAEFTDVKTRVHTLAYWADGRLQDNIEFDLAGTPCKEAVRGALCHHPAEVWRRFPRDVPLKRDGDRKLPWRAAAPHRLYPPGGRLSTQLTNVKFYPGTASCVCKLGMARTRGFSTVFMNWWRVCKNVRARLQTPKMPQAFALFSFGVTMPTSLRGARAGSGGCPQEFHGNRRLQGVALCTGPCVLALSPHLMHTIHG